MRIARLMMFLTIFPMGISHAALGEIPFAVLVGQAEVIVQGRVESILDTKLPLDPSRGQEQDVESVALNIANLSVDKVLKGPVGIRRIRIEFLPMEDSPRYKLGETVIVFLTKAERGELYTTVGMLQGRFLIKNGMIEREQIPVAEFFRRIKILMQAPSPPER